jgi:hypothetical protein
LKTTLALRLYHLDRGAYPARLEDLTPGYLEAVPADPFALKATLRYRRWGGKYVLYSIGPDGGDDGGTPARDQEPGVASGSHYVVKPDSKGDIVAGINTL